MIDKLSKLTTHKHWNWLVFALILSYSFIVWWQTRDLPYYWDGAMTTNRASHIILERKFNPLIIEYTDFAHPPLFNLLHIAFLKLFGDTLLSAHLLMLPFLPLYLWSVYLVSQKVIKDKLLSLAATAIVAVTPFILSEYSYLYIDLPMSTLVMASLAAQFHKKSRLATLLITLGALIKFNALLALPAIVYLAWKQSGSKRTLQENLHLLMYITPIACTLLWVIYHHHYTQWWFVIPGRESYIPTSIEDLQYSITQVAKGTFVDQNRWVLALAFLFGLSKCSKTAFVKLEMRTSLIYFISFMLFFIFMGEIVFRYLLPVYPVFVILVLSLLTIAKLKGGHVLGFCLLTIILFAAVIHPKNQALAEEYLIKPPEDFRIKDIISLGVETSKFIEGNYKNAKVYGSYPESYQLTSTNQGYIQSPIEFMYCNYFEPNIQADRPVLVFHHLYSPLQPACAIILKNNPATKIKRFEKNGFWVDVYLITQNQG